MSPVDTAATPTPAAAPAAPAAAPAPATVPAAPSPVHEIGSPEFFRDALSKASQEEAAPQAAGSEQEAAEQAPHEEPRAAENPLLGEVPDAESAQDAVNTSAKYHKFAAGLDQIGKAEDAQNFWVGLWNDFALKDAQGNITGPHPAFHQLELAIFDVNAQALTKNAQQTGAWSPPLSSLVHDALDAAYTTAMRDPRTADNSDLIAAISVVREILPRPSNKRASLTPDQQAQQSRIDRERSELDTRKANERTTALDGALSAMQTEIDDALVDEFLPMLERASLSEFAESNAVAQIENQLKDELSKDQLYSQRKARLAAATRRNPTKENIAALRRHEISYGKMKVKRIAEEVLGRASAPGIRAVAGADGSGSVAASQEAWERLSGNAGTAVDLDFHFNRILGQVFR